MPSVFTRIVNRELPAKIFHETDQVIVIADHEPRDRCHLLIIPKAEYPDFQRTPEHVLSLLNETAKMIACRLGIEHHYRLLVSNGYGQEVPHLHIHFLSDQGAERLTYLQT